MKTFSRKFHLLAPIALAFAAAGTMSAQATYTYTLNLPLLISGTTEFDVSFWQYEFSWLGPLEFNAPAGSSCPTGCPVTGTTPGNPAPGLATYSGVNFTASTGGNAACTGSPSGGCAEIDLSYAVVLDFGGPLLTEFRLIEPDSFWLNPTSSIFFANNPSGEGGVGASILVVSPSSSLNGPAVDPLELGCRQCSVSIAATTATPEPGTWLLLAAGSLAAFGLVLARRVLRTA